MKNILEQFLDAIEVPYTQLFAEKLYNEHPHRNNMYGLKKMLDVYGVKTIGVRIEPKELSTLNFPCILHTHGDFAIGLDTTDEKITYLIHGKKTEVTHGVFKKTWTGNALVVSETTDANEPEIKRHRQEEILSTIKRYSIPVLLTLTFLVGLIDNAVSGKYSFLYAFGMILSMTGIAVCAMLMQKQLFNESKYGDRVCSLFHHTDCNSILDGAKAKIWGISWSEVGLGFFIANTLLFTLLQEYFLFIAIANWMAMLYGFWSVYYQWRIAKNCCVLCVMVQAIIWIFGILSAWIYISEPNVLTSSITGGTYVSIAYLIGIMAVHYYATSCSAKKERINTVQRYRALKANTDVAKALIQKQDYYETTLEDSCILFGNRDAKMRITILSNPHCNPCARMHERVDKLLDSCGDDICVQYIFSSFNEQLEDSSRYLISCYNPDDQQKSKDEFTKWYAGEKNNHEDIVKRYSDQIHKDDVEKELNRHKEWRKRTNLIATPTILVNGFELPAEYEIEDLAMIIDGNFVKQ
jgi:uncharacterized membrane protein